MFPRIIPQVAGRVNASCGGAAEVASSILLLPASTAGLGPPAELLACRWGQMLALAPRSFQRILLEVPDKFFIFASFFYPNAVKAEEIH